MKTSTEYSDGLEPIYVTAPYLNPDGSPRGLDVTVTRGRTPVVRPAGIQWTPLIALAVILLLVTQHK